MKNITMNTVKKNIGFSRREDLDFSDDGNYFRAFEYTGADGKLVITTLRTGGETFLQLRPDYIPSEEKLYTWEQWRRAGGSDLAHKYNGTREEFAEDDLVRLCEDVLILHHALNRECKMKDKQRKAEEAIEHGTVKFEKEEEYFNNFTGRMCTEHMRHIEYNGELWAIVFINNRFYDAFVLN